MSYLADDELGESYILRYRELYAAGRIGAVWLGHAGVCWLSPADAADPWSARAVTTHLKLRALIDDLEQAKPDEAPQAPSLTKIPPQSA